jgi:hypothetical protein
MNGRVLSKSAMAVAIVCASKTVKLMNTKKEERQK